MSPSDRPTKKPGPLTGIRVLDLTRVLSGPVCSRILADMGADVVKVEPPETDILRSTPPRAGGLATMYAHFNVGKRNISLDLKAEGGSGTALLERLVDEADVLLENYRPGVMAKLGLGPDALLARNPRLIYCSITGWGQAGPWAERPAYAPIVSAEAGVLELAGRLRGGAALGETQQHGDVYAGLLACNAISAALFERERSGHGQQLDIAMGESLLYVNEHAAAELQGYDGPGGFETWTFATYRLADGRGVHVLGNPIQTFPALVHALDIREARDDPRFGDTEAIAQNLAAAIDIVAAAVAKLPDQAAFEAKLAGLPMVVAGVRSMREVAASEWAAHRVLTAEAAPGLRVPRAPWHSNTSEIGTRGGVASRGADNRAVLGEWLGMSAAEVDALEARGPLEHDDAEPPTLDEAPRKAFRDRGERS